MDFQLKSFPLFSVSLSLVFPSNLHDHEFQGKDNVTRDSMALRSGFIVFSFFHSIRTPNNKMESTDRDSNENLDPGRGRQEERSLPLVSTRIDESKYFSTYMYYNCY